ncbi:S26 family signal peptidase [Streptomyces violaceusniger]|uniref:Peptidase S26 domain-containing protein n=1 Tax=Streptomyces violaceusniger TaxID=68280 RepID=A0A4D4LCZ0_STRVO|nr:hypothetical protein SVIO_070700 [Streptomyces violaceusniger]
MISLFGVLRRRFVVVTVRGTSMRPAYDDGDQVLVRRDLAPARGRVVVVERPSVDRVGWRAAPVPTAAGRAMISGREWLIKRVAAAPGDPVPRDRVPALAHVPEDRIPPGRLVLLGDNVDVSFDSRLVGYFPAERVLGTVLRPLPRR